MYSRHYDLLTVILCLLVLVTISSCATPISPTGGQPDRSGPKLAGTYPVTGTTNFNAREVRFEFEDWVDRASFQRAFSIEPGLDIDFDIRWRRKTAIIRLNSPLPDSTTIIFSLDNNLRDTRSNRITKPIRVAVSTGDKIDQGSVSFKVIPAYPLMNKTEPVILLYREPIDLTQPALYSSAADTSGVIRFNYLAEGDYRAILVHDINRNRTWDSEREFAQTMVTETFSTALIDTSEYIPFYYAKRDTTSPAAQTIGLLSSNRLRIQFSKPIPYQPSNYVILADSLGNRIRTNHLYNDMRDQSVGFFQTQTALNASISYTIINSNLSDANGNSLRIRNDQFEGSSEADTTRLRFIAPFNGEGLAGRDSLFIRYSTLINDSSVLDSLKIFVNREDARDDFEVNQTVNKLVLSPKNRWNPSNTYQIRTWDPSVGLYKDVRIQVTDDSENGDLRVVISDSIRTASRYQLYLYQPNGSIYRQVSFADSVSVMAIRPGSYHLLIFEDQNETGEINYGTVQPFSAPGYMYSDPRFPIRARMSSELILD